MSKYVEANLHNSSGKTLTLISNRIWVGAENTFFPEIIQDKGVCEFKHSADSGNGTTPGCIGALAYKLNDDNIRERKWIVAWSNPEGHDSKVYADIIEEAFTWDTIKNELDNRGQPTYQIDKFGYHLEISIPPKERSATMKAYIEKPIDN